MSSWSRRAAGAAAITAALSRRQHPGQRRKSPRSTGTTTTRSRSRRTTREPIDLAVMPDPGPAHGAQRPDPARRPGGGDDEGRQQFDVYTSGEQGMQTVSLDPDFANNRWVYLYYAPGWTPTATGNAPGTLPAGETEAYWDRWKGYMVLSRFKWDPAAQALDLTTKQDIIKVDNRGGSPRRRRRRLGRRGDLPGHGRQHRRGCGQRRRATRRSTTRPGNPASMRAAARATPTICAARSCASRSARRHVHDPAGQPVPPGTKGRGPRSR